MIRRLEFILIRFEKLIKHRDPIKVLSLGYLTYMLIGFVFLALPFSTTRPVTLLDNLFMAVSAVSTTGLVPLDFGASYSFFGELVVLLLIQLGGLGYMTFGSFIVLQTGHRISATREKMTRTAFPLPSSLNIRSFLKGVVVFTFVVELLGAGLLSYFFWVENLESPIWFGIFHSISAFCTAGFSLNPDSFESFSNHFAINMVLSVLSILGAVGFIVAVDFWQRISGRRSELLFTSKIILLVTFLFLFFGAVIFASIEPTVSSLPLDQRVLQSFFQTMSSTSTVGFNSLPVDQLSPDSIMLLYFLMLFGASPSGTGGGLKSTTFSALFALVKSTLKKSEAITLMGRKIPEKRLQLAASSFVFCIFILGLSIFILAASESARFDVIVFEALSALGTVGLSMGLTGDLSAIGKLVIISLMIIGRVGVLTFGLAISTTGTDKLVEGDSDLVI